jgi:pyruvate dehydrogenase (quinone)
VGVSLARLLPANDALAHAAEVLNAGERVALLVGAGASGAEDLVELVADRLQAGCAKALLGKAVLPDDLPWVTGALGLLGTLASSDMMQACDTLAALLPLLVQKTGTAWREEIARKKERGERVGAARAESAGIDGINPEDLFVELDRQLPERCVLTADAGTSTNWAARHLRMRRGMKWSLSGGIATMGSAVPYAIAAKFAFPDRTAVAVTGDGAMQMNGMNELITLKRYVSRWSDPSIVFVVANNRDLNQVTWEMRIESGAPDFPASQHLPDVSMAAFARLLGFEGLRIERAADLPDAFAAAFAARAPVVVEVLTDPNVSLPAHVTREQMLSFGSAMLKNDPEARKAIVQSVKGVIAGMFPHTPSERV